MTNRMEKNPDQIVVVALNVRAVHLTRPTYVRVRMHNIVCVLANMFDVYMFTASMTIAATAMYFQYVISKH